MDRHESTVFTILIVLGIAAFVVMPLATGFAASLSLSPATQVTIDEDAKPGLGPFNPKAGGWRMVGPTHPGWSDEKWQRWLAKHGNPAAGCWPPARCKPDRDPKPKTPGD